MILSDDSIRTLALLAQQLVPLVVVILIPLVVFTATTRFSSALETISALTDAMGLSSVWTWVTGSGHSSAGSSHSDRKKIKKKPRTRTEQLAQNGHARMGSSKHDGEAGYYPGLVNISGTYCFMDSTLQALASLCYLQPYLDAIHAKAEALDVPTPITDALRDLLQTLNTPTSSPSSLRPTQIIQALSSSKPGKQRALFASREHQDAQELFQLVSECVKEEALAVDREGKRDRGFAVVSVSASAPDSPLRRQVGRSVFDGLTANRRSCTNCGYTEAVMHFGFDNWQLTLPGPRAGACRLEECLAEYTTIVMISDCTCRRCSLVETLRKLEKEADRLSTVLEEKESATSSRKRRAREARKYASRLKAALDEGRIEDDVKGVEIEKVFCTNTKQAMVARPPPVLALHLNRSMYFGHHAGRNNVRVYFPELLDLSPFTTSGSLSTSPAQPISASPPTPTRTRTLYRLSAVVCHYGEHTFGHYVCYRRTPRPPSTGVHRFDPPRLACPIGCQCKRCAQFGPVREEDALLDAYGQPGAPGTGRGWLRISDDSVREVGIETVLAEGVGAFMIYYERVVLQPHGIPVSPSEETLAVPSVNDKAMMDPQKRTASPAAESVRTTSSEETVTPEKTVSLEKAIPSVGAVPSAPSASTVASSTLRSMSNRQLMEGGLAIPVSARRAEPPARAGSVPRVVRNVSASVRRPKTPPPPTRPLPTPPGQSDGISMTTSYPPSTASTASHRPQSVLSTVSTIPIPVPPPRSTANYRGPGPPPTFSGLAAANGHAPVPMARGEFDGGSSRSPPRSAKRVVVPPPRGDSLQSPPPTAHWNGPGGDPVGMRAIRNPA